MTTIRIPKGTITYQEAPFVAPKDLPEPEYFEVRLELTPEDEAEIRHKQATISSGYALNEEYRRAFGLGADDTITGITGEITVISDNGVADTVAVRSPLGWWWLSFCDTSKPADGFAGACSVEGSTLDDAVRRATDLGINPGGEVLGLPIHPSSIAMTPASWRRRLLTTWRAAHRSPTLRPSGCSTRTAATAGSCGSRALKHRPQTGPGTCSKMRSRAGRSSRRRSRPQSSSTGTSSPITTIDARSGQTGSAEQLASARGAGRER
jgi:hypothetical protein